MRKRIAAAVVSLALASSDAGAEPARNFDGLAGLIERTKAATSLPTGTAVVVIEDGEVVYEGYFGFADIERRTPVTRDTSFYIASVTKPFLALNTLLQEANGKLDTRASLQEMFPGLRFKSIDAGSVTARDLLGHSSGIDNEPLVWAAALSGVHDAKTRRALVAASYPAAGAARGTFNYTNVGYNIAGEWLDRTLAMPWQDQLDATIFRPLGMTRTSAHVSWAEVQGWPLARPYSFASADPGVALYLRKSDDTMQAAGGLLSTAPDLATFVIAQLSDGRRAGRQVFPPSLIARSHRPLVATAGRYLEFERNGYAWGWYTGPYKGVTMLHHFGGFAGFHAHLSFIPEKRAGLVVLNNEDVLSSRLTGLIADHVYGVLLDEPDVPSRSAGRFDELIAQAARMRESLATQRQAIRNRAFHLSRPPEAYAGTYSNDLLGDMVVAPGPDRTLTVRWGRLAAIATGYEREDTVRVEFAPNAGEVLTFVTDAHGVAAISFASAVFARKP